MKYHGENGLGVGSSKIILEVGSEVVARVIQEGRVDLVDPLPGQSSICKWRDFQESYSPSRSISLFFLLSGSIPLPGQVAF